MDPQSGRTVIAAGFDNSVPGQESTSAEAAPAAIPAAVPEPEPVPATVPDTSAAKETDHRIEEHQIPTSLPSERSSSNFDNDLDIPDFLK